jgi:hypothetical protein
MTREGGMFNGMMAEQSKTMNGVLSTLKDTWNATLREIGQTLIKEIDLKSLIKDVAQFTKDISGGLVWAFKMLGKTFTAVKHTLQGMYDIMIKILELTPEILTLGGYESMQEERERLAMEKEIDRQSRIGEIPFGTGAIDVPRASSRAKGSGALDGISPLKPFGEDIKSAAETMQKAAAKWEANASTEAGSREAMLAIARQTRGQDGGANLEQKQLAVANEQSAKMSAIERRLEGIRDLMRGDDFVRVARF